MEKGGGGGTLVMAVMCLVEEAGIMRKSFDILVKG